MSEFHDDSNIDSILTESLRRRGASAQIGGGTLADVHRRVQRRRRRLVGAIAAAIVLPLAAGVVVLAGRDDSPRVASVGEGSDESSTTTPGVPTVDPEKVCSFVVTSGSVLPTPTVVGGDEAMICRFEGPGPVPFFAGGGNAGWRCTGEPTKGDDSTDDAGWVIYPYCEPLCVFADGTVQPQPVVTIVPGTPDIAVASTIVLTPSTTVEVQVPSTIVAGTLPPLDATSTTVEPSSATSVVPDGVPPAPAPVSIESGFPVAFPVLCVTGAVPIRIGASVTGDTAVTIVDSTVAVPDSTSPPSTD